jgi:hypothetical protein
MCAKVNGRQGPELKAKEAQALLFQFPCHYGDKANPNPTWFPYSIRSVIKHRRKRRNQSSINVVSVG